MNIAIIGAGAYGQALAKILTDNQHTVKFYDPNIYPDVSLDAACYQAAAIIIAIPSIHLADFLNNYPERFHKIPTILASKA